MATFTSVGECWEWANYSDQNGNLQASYFRCPEEASSYEATPISTEDRTATATATFTEATTNPPAPGSSTYEEYQTPAASPASSAAATIEVFTVPVQNSSTSTSTRYVASAVGSVYVSSSYYNSTANGTSSPDPSKGSNNDKPSPLPIVLAVVFATLFALLLLGLLIFYLRRRRARRRAEMTPFYPPQGEGILSDRRVSQAFTRFPSRGSTTSYTPEPTFIQPVLGTVGLGAGVGGRILTSREKRLTMRRAGGGEEERAGGGWEENGDEVLRRKMEGWNAVAERTSRLPEGGGGEKDPFADSYSVRSNQSHLNSTLPSLPPPLRLPLTITTSLAPPRSSRIHLNPNSNSLSPSPSLNSPNTLSPQFDPSYSPAEGGSTESHVPLLDGEGQAEDGGVSLMGGMQARERGQAPPAYIWH